MSDELMMTLLWIRTRKYFIS